LIAAPARDAIHVGTCQQSFAILAEHRVVPHWFIHFQPHKPSEQQVIVHLLHQHPLAADRVEDLQQRRAEQPLGRNRRPASLRVQALKLLAHAPQDLVHAVPDGA